MTKKTLIAMGLALIALLSAGCAGEEKGELSKSELEQLKNPSKEMPPEAIEAMKNAGANRPAIDPNMAPEAAKKLAEEGGAQVPPGAASPGGQ